MPNGDDFEFKMISPLMDLLVDDIENSILSPLSCLREFDSCWTLEFDLPLVREKDIKITFDESVVYMEAKLKEKYSQELLGQIIKFKYFKKAVHLPGKMDSGKVGMEFRKGRLTMNIGKKKQTN